MKNIVVPILVFISLISLVNAIGIGVSPSVVEFNDALKGSSYSKEIKIDNTGELPIIAKIEIINYSEIFSIESGNEVEIPGESSSKVKVVIEVPSDISVGDYETMIYVRGTLKDAAPGMGLIPGAGIKAKISVTDSEIVNGFVDKILTRDADIGENVRFVVGYMNNGNVPSTPTVEIIVEDKVVNKELESVEPGENKEFTIEMEHEFEKGFYQADVKVMVDGKVLEEKEVGFAIVSEGDFKQIPVEEVPKTIEGPNTSIIVGLGLIVLIIFIGLLLYFGVGKLFK